MAHSVGDKDARLVGQDFGDRMLEKMLVDVGIDGGERVVENVNVCVGIDCPSN